MGSYTPIVGTEQYKNGLFPTIPTEPDGIAIILTDGKFPPTRVDKTLSIRQIRKGSYSRLVRIATTVHQYDVYFNVPSENDPYQFAIHITMDVRVTDPLAFYNAQIDDVSIILKDNVYADVRRIAKGCAIKDYKTLDEDILDKVQIGSHEINDAQWGISYRVKDVEARPDKEGLAWIKRMTDHTLTVEEETHKANTSEALAKLSIEKAILGRVSVGELTMEQALHEIERQKRERGTNQINDIREMISFIKDLREEDFFTDTQAADLVNGLLRTQKMLEVPSGNEKADMDGEDIIDSPIDDLYKEEG